MFFKVDKIEERDNPVLTNDPEYLVILRFSRSAINWGWANNLAGVIRRAVNGLADNPVPDNMN
jgi:hypothetical protein